ncbi:protein unc-13 [Tanacetum coccineum]
MAATQHVYEVLAYRLVFLDSNSVMYGSLYIGHAVNARISLVLRVLKQNLTLLSAIADHEMIEDDLKHLKRVFSTYREGLITEDVVEKEAETVEGVVALMKKSTEQLVEDFTVRACEASGDFNLVLGDKITISPRLIVSSRNNPNVTYAIRLCCFGAGYDALAHFTNKKLYVESCKEDVKDF